MASLSADMAALAVSLIDEFGVVVPMSRVAEGGTYDPAQGKVIGGAGLNQGPKALTENKGLYLGAQQGVVGDKKITFAAQDLTFQPEPGDTFVHGNKIYTIMKQGVKPTEVEGVVVLYEVYGIVGA